LNNNKLSLWNEQLVQIPQLTSATFYSQALPQHGGLDPYRPTICNALGAQIGQHVIVVGCGDTFIIRYIKEIPNFNKSKQSKQLSFITWRVWKEYMGHF
jgi:hypothetical protein